MLLRVNSWNSWPIKPPRISRKTIEHVEVRRRIRTVMPEWLKRRLIPFECELERLAREFCSTCSGRRLLDLAGGSASYAPGFICLDKNFTALLLRDGLRVCADAHDLPVRPGSIDAACCSAALHHFEDPGRGLSQMWECLRSGGDFFMSVPCLFPRIGAAGDYHRFERAEIVNLLEAGRWRVVSCDPIGGRFWVLSRTLLEGLFQWCAGFRIFLFLLAAPLLGFLIPLCCYYLDRADRSKTSTLGWKVVARKEA